MLYDRWCEIVRRFGDEIALRDCGSGQHFTFRQLDELSSQRSHSDARPAFPQGTSADFVIEVLQAWRLGKVVCPLEVGQRPPEADFSTLPRDCVHLKMTSATTGQARFVAFTASQLAADADNIVSTMGLRVNSPNLGVISLAHSYGFSNLILPLLLHGIPLVLGPSPLPENVRKALRSMTNVTLPAVPALWRAWHDAGVLENVRLAISAGAPLPLALEQAVFECSAVKIHNFYGSSECGGIAYDRTSTPRTDAACAGAPMDNVRVSIGEYGCMEVSGNAVGQTYWPEPADALQGGVFRTSDLAEIRNCLVYLCGRAGDLINVAGRKLSPETIERALLSHANVADCLVFGAPSQDTQRTETIVACVVPRHETSADGLKKFLLSQLQAWQVPREWWFVESLQTNARGKLSRNEWRRKFLALHRG